MGTISDFYAYIITGENTVNSYVCVQLWFSRHITGEYTVNSYGWGHLLVFYAYYW